MSISCRFVLMYNEILGLQNTREEKLAKMIENAIKDYLGNEQNEIIAVWDRLSEFYQLPLIYLNTLSDEAKKKSKDIL